MAFAAASKGAPLIGLLKKLLAAPSGFSVRPASVAAARRLFNTGGARLRRDDNGNYEESSGNEDRRRGARDSIPMSMFCEEGEDPFVDPARLGRLMALMEDDAAVGRLLARMENDAMAATRFEWWVSNEDDDAVQLKVAMPGLGKEHVKVSTEKNILVIEGSKDPKDGDEQGPARYTYTRRIRVPSEAFEMEQIKAKMENGVLTVTVPKIKNDDAMAATRCEWWVSKEDDDAVQLKVSMPGLGKEHVKVSTEKNILVIEGSKDPKETGDEQGPARYTYTRRIRVPSEAFEMKQIKAEMENGVLTVTVPKIKNNELKDVIEIKVE